jgi:hypothetical protein
MKPGIIVLVYHFGPKILLFQGFFWRKAKAGGDDIRTARETKAMPASGETAKKEFFKLPSRDIV